MISTEVRVAIRCPTCGAGLDILGGGRVTTHVCPYCASALDATESYRLLATYSGMPRAQSPLAIGMETTLDGVSWTIIGVLTLQEWDEDTPWTWVDHLLYSPTHGYCWLTLEDGHLTLTRRWRKGSSPGFIGQAKVGSSKHRPTARADDTTFTYYESTTGKILSIEGEFTWRPRPGDLEKSVSLLGPGRMLTFVESARETEVEMTTYPDQAALWASFGVSDPPRPKERHPLQIRSQQVAGLPQGTFLKWASAVFSGLSFALTIVYALDHGHAVLYQTAVPPFTLPFTLEATGRRTEIELTAFVPENTWVNMEPEVTDPEDQLLFAVSREVGVYSGTDSEGHWVEGSNSARVSFHPSLAGSYEIALDPPEIGLGDAMTGTPGAIPVQVTVRADRPSTLPPLVLAVAFAALAMTAHWIAAIRKAGDGPGSDWEDDD